jgi:hypothetical protein
MSSTRRAPSGSPFRQERFASSPEYERGLLANLVAKRCGVLDDARDRELIWYLQWRSWQPGGLGAVALEILQEFPDEFASPLMRKLGFGPKRVYSRDEVIQLRAEGRGIIERAPLKGETCHTSGHEEFSSLAMVNASDVEFRMLRAEMENEARGFPDSYPSSYFQECYQRRARNELAGYLAELCADPAKALDEGPLYLPRIREALRQTIEHHFTSAAAGVVVTEIGKQLADGLEFALETRSMVLIDGLARSGKTFAAKAWCRARPGRVRFSQVPSHSDEIGFFVSLARDIGIAVESNPKATKLRERVARALQGGDLMLVLDEAHYLWPQTNCRDALPQRINWIMTALVNYGVPVALITTPQFLKQQRRIEEKTCWTSEQFTGRLRYIPLPITLSKDDLSAVAHSVLPEASEPMIRALASYADVSCKHLAAIGSAARVARWHATKAGRDTVTAEDVRRAIAESLPSDRALADAMAAASKPSQRGKHRPAIAPQTVRNRSASEPNPTGSGNRLSSSLTIGNRTIEPKVTVVDSTED